MKIPVMLFLLFILMFSSVDNLSSQSLKATPDQKVSSDSKTIPEFIANQGQIADQDGNLNPDVLFLAAVPFGNITINKTGISYTFISYDEPDNPVPALPGSLGLTGMEQQAPENRQLKVTYYRTDMQLLGANRNPELITPEE